MRLFANIMWAFFKLCRPTRPSTQAVPSFRTVNMRALGFRPRALHWSFEEQATFTPTPCTLWEAATWFSWCLFDFCAVAFIWLFISNVTSDIFYRFVADRRATARTKETLSMQQPAKKKSSMSATWPRLVAFLLSTDQPVRSSYQPMTIIAYLHDCHCRYDERSTVQKKKLHDTACSHSSLLYMYCHPRDLAQPQNEKKRSRNTQQILGFCMNHTDSSSGIFLFRHRCFCTRTASIL